MARKRSTVRKATPIDWHLLVDRALWVVLGAGVAWVVASYVFRAAPAPNWPVGVPDPLRTTAAEYPWTQAPLPEFPLPPYARFLQGTTIVLDPGHIGQRDPGGTWKRGPTGLREAEVNLRVALYLREFLEAVGARVVLTREVDRSLDLPDVEDLRRRAAVANDLRADLFLSIHHNAAADPRANYTVVFYHGRPQDNPASVAAGRFVLQGLQDALRLERHIDCALLSDHAMTPNAGFAVLRHAQVPAVLTEASFFTHPDEEQRLRNPVYNRREAYGLFVGLARWAQAGLPRIRLAEPANGVIGSRGAWVVALDNGLSGRRGWGAELPQLLEGTLSVRVGGRPVEFRYDATKSQVRVTPPRGLAAGKHELFVDFANVFGQHVLHPRIAVEYRP